MPPLPGQIEKPIKWITPPALVTHHVTHLMVKPMPGRYILAFYECLPPTITATTETDMQAAWAQIASIPATCVARLVITEKELGEFIAVLQQQKKALQLQPLALS